MAPPGDDKVHTDDGQVEEDEEQDQVEGDEQAQRHRLQEEEHNGVGAHAPLLAQRIERAGQEEHRRHGEQRQREPVDTDVVADPDIGDPAQIGLITDRSGDPVAGGARAAHIADPQCDDQRQVQRRHRDPGPQHRGVARARHGEQRDARDERQEDDQGEHASPRQHDDDGQQNERGDGLGVVLVQ